MSVTRVLYSWKHEDSVANGERDLSREMNKIPGIVEKFDESFQELITNLLEQHIGNLNTLKANVIGDGFRIENSVVDGVTKLVVEYHSNKMGILKLSTGSSKPMKVQFDRVAVIYRSKVGVISVHTDLIPSKHELATSSACHVSSQPIFLARTGCALSIFTMKEYGNLMIEDTSEKVGTKIRHYTSIPLTFSIDNDVFIEIGVETE